MHAIVMCRRSFCAVVVVSLLLSTTTGCSISREATETKPNAEIEAFLNTTNIIYAADRYWVKELPEPTSAIGTAYKKTTKSIEQTSYDAFSLVSETAFKTKPTQANITKEELTFSKDYNFTRQNKADVALVSFLSGGAEDVYQIKKKVELAAVWALDADALEPKDGYCKDEYYYVTRVYLGSSSDFGLQQVNYKMKVAGANVGGALEGNEGTTLHVIRQGALALMLQPMKDHPKCTGTPIRPQLITPQLLERELRMTGWQKRD